MHRFRHSAAAALLGALLLQVTFLGSGMACALEKAASRSAVVLSATDAAEHTGHAVHGGARQEAPSPTHDDAPAREHAPAHCPATMTCSAVGLLAAADLSPVDGLSHMSEITASDDAVPASARGAPEPPPPRA
jgi:hypothetical protein